MLAPGIARSLHPSFKYDINRVKLKKTILVWVCRLWFGGEKILNSPSKTGIHFITCRQTGIRRPQRLCPVQVWFPVMFRLQSQVELSGSTDSHDPHDMTLRPRQSALPLSMVQSYNQRVWCTLCFWRWLQILALSCIFNRFCLSERPQALQHPFWSEAMIFKMSKIGI